MALPTDLAPAQRERVEEFLAGVTLVSEHPEHTGPERTHSHDHCSLCPERGGVLTLFRRDSRDTEPVIAHLSCRRRALRNRHRQNTRIAY